MQAREILRYIRNERRRLESAITFIASENIIYTKSSLILKYPLVNKYAEGYPGKRYYSGCKWIDHIENMAIDASRRLFRCNFANVQSYSGSIANLAIYKALIKPGDTILSMEMSSGGHLSHSSKSSYITHFYNVVTYTVDKETFKLDYEKIREIALESKPKLIIAGGSSYPYSIDFPKFREIADEVGAYLFADICHLSGFIATGLHPNCFPHVHVAMCTTHKQLRGYRGAIILWDDEALSDPINRSVFPGLQGGMNPAAVAVNAYCLARNTEPQYRDYMERVMKNAEIMCERLRELGVKVIGTETHMFLIDTKASFGLTGQQATDLLESAGFMVNPNLIPFDTEPAYIASGIRLGTLYVTVLQPTQEEMLMFTDQIYQILDNKSSQLALKYKVELRGWLRNKNIFKYAK